MNIFNSILNSVKETFTNKDNSLKIYFFGIVGYYTVETYKKAMYMLKTSGETEGNWYMIRYGVNLDCDQRLCESLCWPLALIRQISPYIIYGLHGTTYYKNNSVNHMSITCEKHNDVNSDIDIYEEEL